jgi:regulator of sigma E protease
VVAGQAAQTAGIRAGDAIVEVNDIPTADWNQVVTAISGQEAGAPLVLTVERDGQYVELAVQPYFDESSQRWLIGISQQMQTVSLGQSIKLGFQQSYYMTKALLGALAGMISGQMAVDVAGPVGVISIVGQAAETGWQNLLILTAFLCINLGVINLLPIPALDGSRLVFLAVEGVRRKPLPREKEGMIHFIGFALLIGLMVIITFQDVLRLAHGG